MDGAPAMEGTKKAQAKVQGGGKGKAAPEEAEAEEVEVENPKTLKVTEPNKLKKPLVWIDLEMTGLDVAKDAILQIAVCVTDGDLAREIVGPEVVIHQSDEVLGGMNEWCVKHHGKSGLTAAVRASKISLDQAEKIILEFIKNQGIGYKEALIAGNSIHVDFEFLKTHMKELADYFHFRILDVSTVKELCKRWYPADYRKAPTKKMKHTAMSDIKESIAELKYLRKAIFKSDIDDDSFVRDC